MRPCAVLCQCEPSHFKFSTSHQDKFLSILHSVQLSPAPTMAADVVPNMTTHVEVALLKYMG